MKRLAEFFTHKWTVGTLGLLALSLLVWFGFDYIKFGEDNATLSSSVRLTIIVLLWSVWFTWQICIWLIERKQNAGLLENIESLEDKSSPDEQRSKQEQQAIGERFRDALNILKKSKFRSKGGKRSLYQLPWYIIIGPPGSGKTTALVNSGLEFPLANSHGQSSLGGVGGTRNCDWWFTNEAVLIDTAGRYTTQDSHRVIDNTAWTAFLTLLKRYRRRRPINGAIIAISLQDLMVQTAEQRNHQAKTIRTRINELQQQLGIRFPIYLTFTKCDLVAGFSEFFANLSQAERAQVWGVTFPMSEEETTATLPAEQFPAEFDQLIDRLNQRVIERIHQERNIEKRSSLQAFPARMETLNDIVSDFIRQTFAPNRYETSPMLRGVYFTSATQEGSPIDRMMASVSANFGLEREMGRQQNHSGKSFFINRLLNDVIFPESELVGVNRRFELAIQWTRRVSFVGLAAGLVGAVLLWAGSVAQNNIYMSEVLAHIADYKHQQSINRGSHLTTDAVLATLDPLLKASTIYEQDKHPWLSNLGLYDGSVDQAAKALYQQALGAVMLPSVSRQLENQITRYSAEDAELLDTLKVYLMLFDENKRDHSQIDRLTREIWLQSLPGQAAKQEQLGLHLNQLLTFETTDLMQPNVRVISNARQKLKSIPIAQRLFAQVKRSDSGRNKIDLYNYIGGNTEKTIGISARNPLFAAPAMFTPTVYKETDFGADSPLLNQLEEDRWIYGEPTEGEDFSEVDRQRISNDIQKIYLSEYEQYWTSLINGVTISPFTSTDQALDLLSQLSDPVSSPLLAIVEITAENTKLTVDLSNKLDDAKIRTPSRLARFSSGVGDAAHAAMADSYSPTNVDLRFKELRSIAAAGKNRPAEIQSYLTALKSTESFLIAIEQSANANEAAYNAAKQRFASGSANAITQLRIQAQNAPAPVNKWLSSVADNTWALLLAKTRLHINSLWREQVYSVYQSTISDRYPVAKGRDSETPAAEFNTFFQPGGIEQKFIANYIAPFMDTNKWRAKQLDGQGVHISADALTQMKRANSIRSAFFRNSKEAKVIFRAEPTKLDSSVRLFTLELGDTRINYSHGPRTVKPVSWTSGLGTRARIIFEDLNETVHRRHYEGDWSLFRLIDASTVNNTGNSSVKIITFQENGRNAEFKVTASSSVNPFNMALLRNYRCPQSL